MGFDVAVTGMGVVSALGTGTTEFTRRLFLGEDVFARSPHGPWPYAPITGFEWPGVLENFAAGSIADRARNVGRRAPRSIRWSLIAALEAHAAANDEIDPEKIALVVAGTNINQALVEATARGAERGISPRYALQFLDSDHIGSIGEVLGLRGEAAVIGAGSASSNAGILHGARLVSLGLADACLVVAAPSDLSSLELAALADLGALSPGAREPGECCRPFDAGRDGFVPGEAAGALFLEKSAQAAARGAPILAHILGGALVTDGRAGPDPSLDGELRAMRAALTHAGLGTSAIDLVSAHATASALGDEIEAHAITELFAAELERVRVVATKGLTGHALNAAGMVQAIAAIVQMAAGRLHPSRNLERTIAPRLRLAGAAAEPAVIRAALCNGFSFGGISSAIVLGR